MTDRAIKWLLFVSLAIGAPVLFYMFMYMAYIPLVGIPAIFLQDPSFGAAIVCLVNLSFYGGIFYLASRALAKLIARLPKLVSMLVTLLVCVPLLSLPFFPLYGGCYAGCDHKTLFTFYVDSAK